jgi:hypothetical protein
MFVKPFINDQDEEIEKQFVSAHYYFDEKECSGFAAAYLYDTLSISFQSSDAWKKNNCEIQIKTDSGEVRTANIKNVFSKGCFEIPKIRTYISIITPVVLIPTTVLSINKSVHFAPDHHGLQELETFWSTLKNNQYVESARSTAFARGNRNFIVKIEPEKSAGVIIIAPNKDHNTLWVQTTGRNYHETKKIAEGLQKNYA